MFSPLTDDEAAGGSIDIAGGTVERTRTEGRKTMATTSMTTAAARAHEMTIGETRR